MVQRKRRRSKKRNQLNLNFLKPIVFIVIIISVIYFAISNLSISSSLFDTNKTSAVPAENIQIADSNQIKKLVLNESPIISERVAVRQTQVEILNGCGVAAITDSFRGFFERNNVDVISTANYKDFNQDKSFLIIYSKSHLELALKLAKLLRIEESLIIEDFQDKPLNELALVLGKDYGLLAK